MADRIGESEDNTAPQSSSSSSKPYLYFSIENILSNETFGSQKKTRKESLQKNGSPTMENIGKSSMQTLFMRLPWLAYTRYFPPKIPRSKPRKGTRKHKLDRNPRIPFSSTQLASLEAKFLQTHYLSGSEVRDLSNSLRVTEHRVKIWFQNRRAREKKNQAMGVVTSGPTRC